jgi:predicted regulator of Ras-like GTPase activity (Roadblock/LC7/MglB family)
LRLSFLRFFGKVFIFLKTILTLMSATLQEALEGIRRIDGVEKAALVSRTGMFIEGDGFKGEDTFSAMSAIILGAAETATISFGSLKKVVVHLDNGKVFIITSVGKKGVLVVLANRDVYDEIEKIKENFDALI